MSEKLQQSISFITSGDRNKGKQLLSEILRTDPKNEQACLWMSTVADDWGQSRMYLQQVLTINPQNRLALKGLEILAAKLPQTEGGPLHFREPSSILLEIVATLAFIIILPFLGFYFVGGVLGATDLSGMFWFEVFMCLGVPFMVGVGWMFASHK